MASQTRQQGFLVQAKLKGYRYTSWIGHYDYDKMQWEINVENHIVNSYQFVHNDVQTKSRPKESGISKSLALDAKAIIDH